MATGSIDLNCSTRWSEWLSFQRSPTDHTDSMGARLGTCWLCKPDANSLKLHGTSITWRYAPLTPRLPVPGNQFEPEVILLAVGWYLRFSLSYCDVEDLLAERACTPTTSRSGGGSSVTPRKWNDVCARGSKRPTTVAGWTRLTSALKASGRTLTGPWTPAVRRSTSCSRPSATPWPPSAFWPKPNSVIS